MKFIGNRRQFKDLVALALASHIADRWWLRRRAWRRLQRLHRAYGSASVHDVCCCLRVALHKGTALVLAERYPVPGGVAAFALCYLDPHARKPGLQ